MKNIHKRNPIQDWNSAPTKFLKYKHLSRFSGVLLLLLSDPSTKSASMQLISNIRKTWKSNGPSWLVNYLKEAHRLCMKALAGTPERSSLRVSTRRGLPLIVPGLLRIQMEKGDIPTIRIVLTILSVYRIIRCKPILKLNTITDPFRGVSKTLQSEEIWQALRLIDWKTVRIRRNANILQSVTSGPNYPISGLGGILDAYAFQNHYPELLKELENVCKTTGMALWELFQNELKELPEWVQELKESRFRDKINLEDLKLGRLSKKLEAAGKVRVFAITDLWTQSALRPLHDYLFDILRKIPQDGTFDQLGPLEKLREEGCKELYSFDLSAATDRLPVDLQEQVLGFLLGESFASSWKKLLVNRHWYLDNVPYQYSVGQPMGALSSWASLALTHHVLVQIAARRAGWKQWFPFYAVLGDDIVIADQQVATNYLALMDHLGVDINLAKSLESKLGLAEFAKRLIGPLGDYSPASPKLIFSVGFNPQNLVAAVRDLVSRGALIRSKDLVRFIEKVPGSKKLPKDFIWNLTGPLGFLNLLGLSPFLGNKSLTEDQLKAIAEATDKVVNRNLISTYYRSIELAHKQWGNIVGVLTESESPGWWENYVMASGANPNFFKLVITPEQADRYANQPYTFKSERFKNWNDDPFDAMDAWVAETDPNNSDMRMLFRDLPSTNEQLRLMDRKLSKMRRSTPVLRDHSILLSAVGYTNETIYQYLVDSFNVVDHPSPGFPNIIERSDNVKPSFSNRVFLYRDLETELENRNLATLLEIRKLPLFEEDLEF